jgi:hypothetical protein
MSTATILNKAQSAGQLLELRRHQVYRLERRRQRSLFSRVTRGLRARFHRLASYPVPV